MSTRFLLFTTVSVLLLPVSVAARPLEEIRVVADPLTGVDAHLSRPVRVLTEEDLHSRESRNIGETVAAVPGVSSSDFGPGVGRPVIRGLSGGRVRVLENGIGTMDASTVSADHAVSAEPVFARQIEIFRGPATLLYGSGASGGLVNIVSDRLLNDIPETPEGELRLGYDSASNGITGALSANAGFGSFALHVDAMARDTGDYDIPGYAERTPDPDDEDVKKGTLTNSDIKSDSYSLGGAWIGDRLTLGVAISQTANNYGIPGGHAPEEEANHEAISDHAQEGGARIDMQQTRYDLQAGLESPLPWLQRIRTRWGYGDYEHDEVEPDGGTGTRFHNVEWEGRLEAVHNPVGIWNGVVGLQYRSKDLSAIGDEAFIPASTMESIAVFMLEKGDFDRWHVDAGLRYEFRDMDSRTGIKADHDAFSLSAGTSWDYTEGYRIGLTVTHSQRVPTIQELTAYGPHLATGTFETGNPALSVETTTNIDLAWHKTTGRLTVTANLFYNYIDDFVFLREMDGNGDGAPDRVEADFDGSPAAILPAGGEAGLLLVNQRQSDAEFTGLELEGVLALMAEGGRSLDLRLWTDYVSGELAGGGNLPRITPWRIGAGIDFRHRPWYAGLDYMYVHRQSEIASLETRTNGYHMLNMNAGYTFRYGATQVSLFVRGSNLLDQEARRHTSFLKDSAPLPGRSALLGIRAVF